MRRLTAYAYCLGFSCVITGGLMLTNDGDASFAHTGLIVALCGLALLGAAIAYRDTPQGHTPLARYRYRKAINRRLRPR